MLKLYSSCKIILNSRSRPILTWPKTLRHRLLNANSITDDKRERFANARLFEKKRGYTNFCTTYKFYWNWVHAFLEQTGNDLEVYLSSGRGKKMTVVSLDLIVMMLCLLKRGSTWKKWHFYSDSKRLILMQTWIGFWNTAVIINTKFWSRVWTEVLIWQLYDSKKVLEGTSRAQSTLQMYDFNKDNDHQEHTRRKNDTSAENISYMVQKQKF